MSKRRKLSDALIMPFTIGLLLGGTATGLVICFGLGDVERLLGGMHTGAIPKNPTQEIALVGEWLATVLLSTLFATLLEVAVVGLIASFAPYPLSPRAQPLGLIIIGALSACGCTIASCLMIDLAPHPELHFYKGPSPPYWGYIIVVCVIAPFLLLRGTAPSPIEPPVDSIADCPDSSGVATAFKTAPSAPRTKTA